MPHGHPSSVTDFRNAVNTHACRNGAKTAVSSFLRGAHITLRELLRCHSFQDSVPKNPRATLLAGRTYTMGKTRGYQRRARRDRAAMSPPRMPRRQPSHAKEPIPLPNRSPFRAHARTPILRKPRNKMPCQIGSPVEKQQFNREWTRIADPTHTMGACGSLASCRPIYRPRYSRPRRPGSRTCRRR